MSGERKQLRLWTDEEIALLKSLYEQGLLVREIAERMGRTQRAIHAKTFELHLPKRPSHFFCKGVNNLTRLGPEREAQRLAKVSASMKAIIRAERRRILFGLEQKTRLRLVSQGQPKCKYRCGLRKAGYLEAADDHNLFFYPNEQMRRPIRESHADRFGIRFAPLKKCH